MQNSIHIDEPFLLFDTQVAARTPEEAALLEAFRRFKANMLATHATFQWTTYDTPPQCQVGSDVSDVMVPGLRFGFHVTQEDSRCLCNGVRCNSCEPQGRG